MEPNWSDPFFVFFFSVATIGLLLFLIFQALDFHFPRDGFERIQIIGMALLLAGMMPLIVRNLYQRGFADTLSKWGKAFDNPENLFLYSATARLNVRETPSLTSKVVRVLEPNEVVQARRPARDTGDWVFVESLEGQTSGYAHRRYLRLAQRQVGVVGRYFGDLLLANLASLWSWGGLVCALLAALLTTWIAFNVIDESHAEWISIVASSAAFAPTLALSNGMVRLSSLTMELWAMMIVDVAVGALVAKATTAAIRRR